MSSSLNVFRVRVYKSLEMYNPLSLSLHIYTRLASSNEDTDYDPNFCNLTVALKDTM